MIEYTAGTWSWWMVFALKGSVYPKAFLWAFPCSMLSLALHTLARYFSYVQYEVEEGSRAETAFSGFTFVLGFLIVFRSQQAYSRWWEGGTLLQQLRGEWFNSYSCLLAFCTSRVERQEEVRTFQQQLIRLYSLLYGCALQQVSCLKESKFDVIDLDGFDETSFMFLQESPDRCEVVLQWIQRLIVENCRNGLLDIAPPILSRVFNELGNGIVNLNNARKIKEFPIPFPLAQMITVMLIIHAIAQPLICAVTISSPTWATIITFVVIFAYWSINSIALELEMPFGDDDNDLPLLMMQRDMNGSLCTLINPHAQSVPHFKQDDQKYTKLSSTLVDFDGDLLRYKDKADATRKSHVGGREADESLPGNAFRLRAVRVSRDHSIEQRKSGYKRQKSRDLSTYSSDSRISKRSNDEARSVFESSPRHSPRHSFRSPDDTPSNSYHSQTAAAPLQKVAGVPGHASGSALLQPAVRASSSGGSSISKGEADVAINSAVIDADAVARPGSTATWASSAISVVDATDGGEDCLCRHSLDEHSDLARQNGPCPQEVALPPLKKTQWPGRVPSFPEPSTAE